MSHIFRHALLAAALVAMAAPSHPQRPVEATPVQLSAAQSHRYQVNSKAAFNAALSTLQTLGYVDINADRESGTISGTTEGKAKTIFNIFWGFGKKKFTQKASLLIEDTGAGALVRLNLTVYETKARGIFGTSFTDGKLIRFAEPYNDFFRYLDGEVAQRGGRTGSAMALAEAQPAGPVDLGGGVRLIPAETESGYCLQVPLGYIGTGSMTRPVVSQARPRCG